MSISSDVSVENISDFRRFADQAVLTAALEKVVGTRRLSGVSIGLQIAGKSYFADASSEATVASSVSDKARFHCGCIAKCLTAMLVARAIAENKIALTDNVWQLLGASLNPKYEAQFSSTTIDHLLNHTHGLDDSSLDSVPRNVDGFIDVQSLCSILSQIPVLAPPGALFSYSSAGIWLAAAILERLYGVTYSIILERGVFESMGIVAEPRREDVSALHSSTICPATGDRLKLSVRDLLKIACSHLGVGPENERSDATSSSYLDILIKNSRTPGVWKPKVRRICLGWNDYGGGWYGHNAKFRGDSVILRFSPKEQVAIAIAARQEHAAYVTLGGMFGERFDEFRAMSIPRKLSGDEWSKVDASRYLGRYANATTVLEIGVTADRSLKVSVRERQRERPNSAFGIRRRLVAAADGVFFSRPADLAELPFVQFVDLSGDKYRYLFSNQRLFPRID